MWKLIFLVLVVWISYYVITRIIVKKNENEPIDRPPNTVKDESELMVKCEKCAVHLPRSEAFLVAGNFYCSQAHLPKK